MGYTHEIQYLALDVDAECPMENGWENYREIFDQCSNLEAITFVTFPDSQNLTHQLLCNCERQFLCNCERNKAIWEERISYFQARGIQILDMNQISQNENLRKKLAKEAGVSWRFHILYHG